MRDLGQIQHHRASPEFDEAITASHYKDDNTGELDVQSPFSSHHQMLEQSPLSYDAGDCTLTAQDGSSTKYSNHPNSYSDLSYKDREPSQV